MDNDPPESAADAALRDAAIDFLASLNDREVAAKDIDDFTSLVARRHGDVSAPDAGEVVAAVGAFVGSGIGLMAVSLFQEVIQRAATDTYDGARSLFSSLRARLARDTNQATGPEIQLIIVRDDHDRWALYLPGNLDHEAHAALIRDFDALTQDDNDGQSFVIQWVEDRWVKQPF
ncbi:hypothetical protein ACFVDH_24495 [Streptomyces sp. NPDC057674]|uniref:hypothetical protein n=1 Tax=Streptomyces sp. NPDC057674 TaxID=3346203 RepID=UPI0036B356DA